MPVARLLLMMLFVAGPPGHGAEPARVFAAASLTDALQDAAREWTAQGHPAPSLTFAGTPVLAKQIEAGAPVDLFAAADLKWMQQLELHGRIERRTRVDLLGNSLVLIAPRVAPFRVDLRRGVDLATAFRGRLCIGEPGVVPVGTYAREALQRLGAWDALAARIVGTDDVRAALAFVERGECGAGIVYATDVRASTRVVVVAPFPEDSHVPIVYPFALLPAARAEARAFLVFLRDSERAHALMRQRGFTVLQRAP